MNYSNSPDVGFNTGSLGAMVSGQPVPQPPPIQNRCSRIHQAGERLHSVLSMLESRLQSVAPEGGPHERNSLNEKEIGPSCELEASLCEMESMVNAASSRVDSLISRLKL